MSEKTLAESVKQEVRRLREERKTLQRENRVKRAENLQLQRQKKALENGIFRLKDEYSRRAGFIEGLETRRVELEKKLHELNEELKA